MEVRRNGCSEVVKVFSKIGFKIFMVAKCCFERFIRIIGPLFVLLAFTLISGVMYVHYANSIPFYAPYTSIGSIMHLIMSIYISVCIMYNYLSAVFVPPGTPPTCEELNLTEAQILHLQSGHSNPDKPLYEPSKFCRRCNRPKPERAHHCHVCGKCVLKMDHHCPWIANCVGHKNHHFFVLFLFWLWLGCGYASILGFIPFSTSSNHLIPYKASVPRGAVIFSFVIAFAVFVALSLMLAWQAYLVLTAQTTIEFYFNKSSQLKNPFDLGTARNFQQFFGTRESKYWFSWLVPGGIKVQGDGTKYPRRSQAQ